MTSTIGRAIHGTSRAVAAAAVYCRISKDIHDGIGVGRQEDLCRELADRLGWPVAEVYVDNDISASVFSRKPRPDYERMMADLRAGRRDAVLSVDVDRLIRQPLELEPFITLADAKGIALANVAGDLDLGTSDGRFKARILGNVAAMESEKKSERVKRAMRQRAEQGKAHGRRPFGFAADGESLLEEEAEILRDVARRVAGGESPTTIARELNDRGIKPAISSTWSATQIRSMLSNPRLIGLRRYRPLKMNGEIESEELFKAAWPPVVDARTFERVQAVLNSAPRTKRGRQPKRLLAGIIRCGECQMLLASGGGVSAGKPVRRYVCTTGPGRGCGKVMVNAEVVEADVRDRLFVALSSSAFVAKLRKQLGAGDDVDAIVDELASLEERELAIAADYADGTMDRKEWLVGRDRLRERKTSLQRVLRDAQGPLVIQGIPAGRKALEAAWGDPATTDEWRRAVLAVAVESVVVSAIGRGHAHTPDRVDVLWRV